MSKRKIGILLLLTAACMFNTYGGSKKSKKSKVQEEVPTVVEAADSISKPFDYILVDRRGGGDKLFALTPNGNDSLDAEFARYRFRDTTFTINLSKSELGDTLSNLLSGILSGEQNIIKRDSVYDAKGFMVGTWMKCHAVKDTVKTLITEEKAKEAITEVERFIETKIEANK
ncbi:MAG: hypothetical protein IK005_01595 [Paludibacteraceae bacterium]|nr:hypothetical protein [Paludibacteraceae bacterium]